MEIQAPQDIELNEAARQMLTMVDSERVALQELGKFPPEVQDELRSEFLYARISDTLNIEGIQTNPRVTQAIAEGNAITDSEKRSRTEIENILAANEFLETSLRNSEPLSVKLIREIHQWVMRDLPGDAGSLRSTDIQITGASVTPPPPPELMPLLDSVSARFEEVIDDGEIHPITAAVWLHHSFVLIHPFADGNGRVGRLLQDYALLRADLLPVGIPAGRAVEYYDALNGADRGEWNDLILLVANAELFTLEKTRRIAEAPLKRSRDVTMLISAAKAKKRYSEHGQYELWRRKVDALSDEFRRWCGEINDQGMEYKVRFKAFEPISFEKWEEIRDNGSARNTWICCLNFAVGRREVYSLLFFAKRHVDRLALDFDREALRDLVCVFVTGAARTDGEPFDFYRFRDPYIRLREIAYPVGHNELWVYRDPQARAQMPDEQFEGVEVTLEEQRWACETEDGISEIVREVMADVFFKLGWSE